MYNFIEIPDDVLKAIEILNGYVYLIYEESYLIEQEDINYAPAEGYSLLLPFDIKQAKFVFIDDDVFWKIPEEIFYRSIQKSY